MPEGFKINWVAVALVLPIALLLVFFAIPVLIAVELASIPFLWLFGIVVAVWGVLFVAFQVAYIIYCFLTACSKKQEGKEEKKGKGYSLGQSKHVK